MPTMLHIDSSIWPEGGLGLDVTFIVPELTLAPIVPAMADLIDVSKASKARAHEDAAAKAKLLAAKAA